VCYSEEMDSLQAALLHAAPSVPQKSFMRVHAVWSDEQVDSLVLQRLCGLTTIFSVRKQVAALLSVPVECVTCSKSRLKAACSVLALGPNVLLGDLSVAAQRRRAAELKAAGGNFAMEVDADDGRDVLPTSLQQDMRDVSCSDKATLQSLGLLLSPTRACTDPVLTFKICRLKPDEGCGQHQLSDSSEEYVVVEQTIEMTSSASPILGGFSVRRAFDLGHKTCTVRARAMVADANARNHEASISWTMTDVEPCPASSTSCERVSFSLNAPNGAQIGQPLTATIALALPKTSLKWAQDNQVASAWACVVVETPWEGIVASTVVQLSPSSSPSSYTGTHVLDVSATWVPYFRITATCNWAGAVYSTAHTVETTSALTHALKVSLTPAAVHAAPNSKVDVAVKVSHMLSGLPTAGAKVTLFAVDESIISLRANTSVHFCAQHDCSAGGPHWLGPGGGRQ